MHASLTPWLPSHPDQIQVILVIGCCKTEVYLSEADVKGNEGPSFWKQQRPSLSLPLLLLQQKTFQGQEVREVEADGKPAEKTPVPAIHQIQQTWTPLFASYCERGCRSPLQDCGPNVILLYVEAWVERNREWQLDAMGPF